MTDTTTKGGFSALLEDLELLTKSAPADGGDGDDAAIADAAEDGAEAGEEADAGEGGEAPDAGAGEEEGFGKSFTFKTDDGEEVDAVDATDLLKSLVEQVGSLTGRLNESEGDMVKALGTAVDLIKSQGQAITTLQGQVKELASAGRGRRTVVSITEKLDQQQLAKSQPAAQPEGLSRDQFLSKASAAFDEGKITGLELTMAETALNKSMTVDPKIVGKVLG